MTPGPGRPRSFDPDQALDAALKVFWRKGYEGATLPELTRAMGINKPSLYAAFGNKESLYKKAIERYVRGPAAHVQAALDAPTAREVAERMLYGAVDLIAPARGPRGCFLVQSALACGDDADCARRAAMKTRAEGEKLIRARLERAQDEGDLARSADPEALARFLSAVTYGLSVQAAGGASREELRAVVEVALGTWPI